MSNATQDSRNSGDNRRRRSRGGQNRRNNSNHQQDRRGGDQRGNDRREPGAPPHQQQPRAEEFRPQGGGSRPARKYSPPKLTFWQKILKAIGLYKEPVRPPRPERKPDAVKADTVGGEGRVKSNTRNVRSDGWDDG